MDPRPKSGVVAPGTSPSAVSTAAPMSRIQTYSTTPIRAAPTPASPAASTGGSSTSPAQPSPMAKMSSPALTGATAPSAPNSSRGIKDDKKSVIRSHSTVASPSLTASTSGAPSSLHMSTSSMGSPQMAAPIANTAPAGLVLTPGAHPLTALETELISQRPIGDDITADAEGLKSLMRRDCWSGTLKLSERCIAEARSPHELLQYRLCRLIALLKLRQYKLLKEEIDALGDLEASPTYTYENYPTYYPNKKGSFVPFTLRLLSAWVPGLLGHSVPCLDALYSLLYRCKSELQNVTANKVVGPKSPAGGQSTPVSVVSSQEIPVLPLTPSPTPHATTAALTASGAGGEKPSQHTPPVLSSPMPSLHASISEQDLETVLSGTTGSPMPAPSTPLASMLDLQGSIFGSSPLPTSHSLSPAATPASDVIEEQLRLWRGRETRVVLCIATRLMMDREYPTAIQVIEDLLARAVTDVNLTSALGRLYLHMGSLSLATELFRKADALIPPSELPNSIAANMNKGLMALAMDQYATAIQCFDAVLRIDPNHLAAVNNRAITLLYTCNLSKAIESLEEYIHRAPETNLNETLVFNLCTLYELATDRAVDKKRELWRLILKYASDSFDPSLLKLTA